MSGRAMRGVSASVAAGLLFFPLFPAGLLGQTGIGDGTSAGGPFPAWARGWTPLAPPVELSRSFPGPPAGIDLLVAPPPRVGLFWTLGNPAALPGEVGDSWTGFATGRGSAEGAYRRPLDPVEETGDLLHGLSWRPIAEWGGAAGEVAVGRNLLEPASFADVLDPHTGSPFVLTDTARADLRRIHVGLQGGIGVALGRWGVGLTGAYGSIDNRTRESGLPRLGRGVAYAAGAGFTRRLGGDLIAGLHGRYRGTAESMTIVTRPASGLINVLEGFQEPNGIPLVSGSFFRRTERDGFAITGGLAGRSAGFDWVLSGRIGQEDETQVNLQQAGEGAPFDRWETDAVGLGLAAQRRLGEPFLLTFDASWEDVSGEAHVLDIVEPVYRSEAWKLSTRTELRFLPTGSGWSLAGSASLGLESRERVDRVVELASDLTIGRPAVTLDAARRLGDRVTLAAGWGVLFQTSSGTVPDASDFGPVAAELVAGEMALYASPATAQRVDGGVRWEAGRELGVWLRGGYGWVTPGDGERLPPEVAMGSRTSWLAFLGVSMSGGRPGS